MFKISKEYSFSASHQLDGLPADHPCSRLHGHNYTVVVHLRGETGEMFTGFIRDYRNIDQIVRPLIDSLDHQHLNDVLSFNPSAERIAEFVFRMLLPSLSELYAVTVKETDKTAATYEP